ncbi:hypothetical protein [Nocardia sp. NPDC057440]|uniref:hypothetical protein n=1 Tax=Nocardia sp. NPDC057440 TaxID=3346134 RepID=UPI003670CEF3
MVVKAANTEAEKAAELAAKSKPKPLPNTVGKNYWPVKLATPAGASAGLKAFITMGEAAIQSAVDLLGRGTTKPPPQVEDLLRPVVYEHLGESKLTEGYKEALNMVESRKSALLTFDTEVLKTSIVVAADQDKTLRDIKDIVADLNTKLKSPGSATLKAPEESALLKAVATAVDKVYDLVTEVAKSNEEKANPGKGNGNGGGNENGNGGGNGGGGSGGGGQGDAGGGLGGALQALAPMAMMIPMAMMPLVQMVPELMKQDQENKEKEREAAEEKQAEANQAQPAAAAPAPGDPNAAPQPGPPAIALPNLRTNARSRTQQGSTVSANDGSETGDEEQDLEQEPMAEA